MRNELAIVARRYTKNIVEQMAMLAFGVIDSAEPPKLELASQDESIRMKAMEWLADRGWGKAPQEVKLSFDDDPTNTKRRSREEVLAKARDAGLPIERLSLFLPEDDGLGGEEEAGVIEGECVEVDGNMVSAK